MLDRKGVSMVKIRNKLRTMSTLYCFRCYSFWEPRKVEDPKCCPKCHSPYWNVPRKEPMAKVPDLTKKVG